MNPLGRWSFSSLVPAAVLVVGLGLLLLNPASWRTETLTVSLQLATAHQPRETSGTVTFVDIDTASLENVGDWPWPRTRIAHLLQDVAAQEPVAILLALPFSGPDAAAPQRAVEAWIDTGAGRAAQAALSQLPDTDAVLLEMVESTGAFLAAGRGDAALAQSVAPVLFDDEQGALFLRSQPADLSGPIARAVAAPLPLGLKYDALGRPAGAFLVVQSGDIASPGAAMLPLLAGEGAEVHVASSGQPGGFAFVDPVGISHVTAGVTETPTLRDGSILFRRDLTVPTLSAGDVLAGGQSDLIRGRTIVIGSTLPRVNETGRSWAPDLSAAQAAALAAAQVAAGTSPARPFVFLWAELLGTLLIGAAALSLAQSGRPWIGLGAGMAGALGAYGASVVLLSQSGQLLDSAAISAVLMLTAAAGLSVAERRRQTKRQRLTHAIEGKLPFGVPAGLNRNPRALLESASSRKVTVLCCAIRGFEDLQDLYKDDPDALASIVQQFQALVGDQVRRFGGTVDRQGGAAILAFWNAPLDEPDHALKACDCALRLVDGLEGLNQSIEAQAYRSGKPFAPIHIGMGINTGRAVAGNVGSPDRPAYSLIGEAVKIASDLEDASTAYGPAIIVAEHTFQAVKNRFALLEIDKLAITRRSYTIRVFALLGNPVTKASPRFRALEEAHEAIFEAYRSQNWSLAEALIGECRKLNGAIPSLYDLYERRIAYFRQFPPGDDWDGAFSIPVV